MSARYTDEQQAQLHDGYLADDVTVRPRDVRTGADLCGECVSLDEHTCTGACLGPSPAAVELPLEDALDVAHFERQREWSRSTFGPGPRTAGVVDHIRKELTEIEDDPADLGEWVDVIILAFDGAWRAGHEPAEIIAAVKAKQARNEARTWPDWRTAPPDKAIEHVRAAPVPPDANGGEER